MSVTVVSCLYGERGFDRMIGRWSEAVAAIDPAPDAVIVATDRLYDIPGAQVRVSDCEWRHPQAWYLTQAIAAAETGWVWIVDMDDQALPDGLDGLADIDADVWQLGYIRTDGVTHIPPQVTPAEYLAFPGNPYTAGSAIHTKAFNAAGGFPDVAFQDWALWRRMARAGMHFQSSKRPHYLYNQHPLSRTSVELGAATRAVHLAEMRESELAVA